MDSRTDAVGLCAKAIMIADALEKIASSLEATCIGIRCSAVWLHGTCARARLGACARLAAVVAAARLLVPFAHTMADARAASNEISRGIWLTDVPAAVAAARLLMSHADAVANTWAASEVPVVLHREREVIVVVREPTTNWLVVVMRSDQLRQLHQVAWGLVQGPVSYALEDLDLKEGREGVRVDGVVGRGRVGRNPTVTHPTWR